MDWFVFLIIDRGIINDRWDFNNKMSQMSKADIKGPWRIAGDAKFLCNIMSKNEAIEKKFIDSNEKLLFWGYPGDGAISFNVFKFNNENAAVNFGAMMEDSFIGLI